MWWEGVSRAAAWLIPVAVGLLAGVALAVFRIRAACRLRLERQRARIAMDLHDEIGSGLGSIGIMAGLASEQGIDEDERRRLVADIAGITAELGRDLSDIVTSLHPAEATLESLAGRLAERGRRLFPSGMTSLTLDFPQGWPSTPLSYAVRRNIFLIGAEALHNAARHAAAHSVHMGFAPHGERWKLWVTDDGCGATGLRAPDAALRISERGGSRLGLVGMRRRAEEIAADLSWSSTPMTGTRVTVIFDPNSEDGGLLSRPWWSPLHAFRTDRMITRWRLGSTWPILRSVTRPLRPWKPS